MIFAEEVLEGLSIDHLVELHNECREADCLLGGPRIYHEYQLSETQKRGVSGCYFKLIEGGWEGFDTITVRKVIDVKAIVLIMNDEDRFKCMKFSPSLGAEILEMQEMEEIFDEK